jgi:hypothetical protein
MNVFEHIKGLLQKCLAGVLDSSANLKVLGAK